MVCDLRDSIFEGILKYVDNQLISSNLFERESNLYKVKDEKSTYQLLIDNINRDFQENIIKEFTSSTKEGVNFVFDQNPELSSIGTPQQYSQYLDTIFPDSKVIEMDNSLYISVLEDLKSNKIIEKQCS